MGKRKDRQAGDDLVAAEIARAWQSACELYAHVTAGRALVPVPTAVRLPQGEQAYADLPLEYARFYSQNVTYRTGGRFLFGSTAFVVGGMIGGAIDDAATRRRAEMMSAPQWRELTVAPTLITNRQTMCMVHGQWIWFEHDAVMSFHPAPEEYGCVLTFQPTSPLRFTGPWAPWASVLIAALLYTPDEVARMPALAPLRAQPVLPVTEQGRRELPP